MPRKPPQEPLPPESGDRPLFFPPIPIVKTRKIALPEPSEDLVDALSDMGVNLNPFATQQQLLLSGMLDINQTMRILENLSKNAMDLMKQSRAAAAAAKQKEKTHEDWIQEIVDEGDRGDQA
jgi:hypothetical protein